MSYLVDSDRVVDCLDGRAPAVRLLGALRAVGLAISPMTYGEVYEGVLYGRDRAAAERAFRRFLRRVDVLPLTRRVLQRFALVRGDLCDRNLLIGDPDALIAATALHSRLTLVTRNRAHLERIPGLAIYAP